MTGPRQASTIFNVAPGYELAEPVRPVVVAPTPGPASRRSRRRPARAAGTRRAGTRGTVIGKVLRSICTMFALVLAVSATLLVAEANSGNRLVMFVVGAADRLDLAVFDVDNGVMKFTGDRADLKNALFNRGIAALVWLFIGRTLERVVAGRPVVR